MKTAYKPEYSRHLPHFLRPGKTFFVTFRLFGSLPQAFLEKLQKDFEQRKLKIAMLNPGDQEVELALLQREYFQAYDMALDACEHGPVHLKDPRIAQFVAAQLNHFDQQYYKLIGYTLMPNHVHALLDFSIQLSPDGTFDRSTYKNLDYVLDRVKGASARYANMALGQTGQPFWQAGSHDRYIRDDRHLTGAIHYLKQNPVSARLCRHWMEFPFTYIHDAYLAR